jgi:hypothetical protein
VPRHRGGRLRIHPRAQPPLLSRSIDRTVCEQGHFSQGKWLTAQPTPAACPVRAFRSAVRAGTRSGDATNSPAPPLGRKRARPPGRRPGAHGPWRPQRQRDQRPVASPFESPSPEPKLTVAASPLEGVLQRVPAAERERGVCLARGGTADLERAALVTTGRLQPRPGGQHQRTSSSYPFQRAACVRPAGRSWWRGHPRRRSRQGLRRGRRDAALLRLERQSG